MHDAAALLLARSQFAFTLVFHFIFPSFTIGLAAYLAVLEGLWLRTQKAVYLDLFRYWTKIFAVNFAMGVVSGIVMSYQFGTNWSVFSDRAGPIVGPLMAYEVMTAFFLEAGFLGVMIFGMKKVGPGLHFFATCMVALGTCISAFWIIAANSWMQTPQGWTLNSANQFVPSGSWATVIFTPSFPYRLVHTLIASFLTTALVVGAVGAWHLIRGHDSPQVRKIFSMAMWMAALVAPVQILVGDQHGLNTLEHQPAKVLAMEGDYRPNPDGAPLILFGLPDSKAAEVKAKIEIPHAGSLILRHDPHAPLQGLTDFPRNEWPPVPIVFWSFRIMVGLATAMLLLGLASLWARVRGQLYSWGLLHRFALVMGPAGFVATTAGWVTTEVGRQPYTIYHVMTTAESVSPIAAPGVGVSLVAFALVYFAAFSAGIFYILRLMAQPPATGEPEHPDQPTHAAGITPAPGIAQPAIKGGLA